MLAWSLLILAIILTVGLLITALHHLFLMTPYIRTSRSLARAMAEFAGLQPQDHVWDLGAGDGSILLEAKKLQPGIRATGVEIVPLVWLLGWLRTRARGMKFLWKDARHVRLGDADVVFLYMTPHMIAQLQHVLSGLKKGARVVSRAFHIPGKTPAEERTVNGAKLLLYRF